MDAKIQHCLAHLSLAIDELADGCLHGGPTLDDAIRETRFHLVAIEDAVGLTDGKTLSKEKAPEGQEAAIGDYRMRAIHCKTCRCP